MKTLICFMVLSFLAAGPAIALPEAVRQELNNPPTLGSARFSFLFKDVYTIDLYSSVNPFNAAAPFALKINYLMPLKGAAIIDRTISLIKRQAFTDETKLAQWQAQMVRFFPDVDKGVSLTGFRDNQGHTQFYRNQQWIGEVNDPLFTQYFFAIWLADNTSEPSLRRALLGLN